MIVAALLAFAAAAAFAMGISLQHRAASAVPQRGFSAPGLLFMLARQPSWWAGVGFSGAAFYLHAAALHQGALSLVQPVVVSGIVFAVFIRSALEHRLPGRKEVGWSLCIWAGLTVFITSLPGGAAGHVADDGSAQTLVSGGVVVTVVAVMWSRKTGSAARRGLLLGGAAGVLFGLIAGLVKMLIAQAQTGLSTVLGHWPLWTILVAGAAAMLFNQRAYQSARISVTMPILNIVDVLVALGFGSTVFGERLFASPPQLFAATVGLVVMGVGVWKLSRQQELATRTAEEDGRVLATTSSGRE